MRLDKHIRKYAELKGVKYLPNKDLRTMRSVVEADYLNNLLDSQPQARADDGKAKHN
jgi:hypothetical protein